MSLPPLLYCPELKSEVDVVLLEGAEVAHAAGARRLRAGDRVELFDGLGLAISGCISAVERRDHRLKIVLEERQLYPEPIQDLRLAAALPKGDRQATMLDSATQLGMTDFIPLICDRTVTMPGRSAIERWRRIAISACKQARRYHLPRLWAAQSLTEILRSSSGTLLLLADPAGDPTVKSVILSEFDSDIIMLVGPEGGFTTEELQLADQRGVHKLWLGPHILRTETAAAAIIAAINQQMPSIQPNCEK